MNDLVVGCANDKGIECTSEEQNQIKNAIDTVMSLPPSIRRFSALLQSISDKGGNCLYQRLLKWCQTEENTGRFAWVLDNPINQFNPDDFKIVGFEVGEILKPSYQPTEPILACLLYLKAQMTKNYDLLCTIVEEFWLPLMYKIPQDMMLDVLKTGRKRGEFMLLITQSPEEAVKSPIFPAIVQQTPTKILLPNPDAEYKNEQGGGYSRIGLTQKEFNQLQKLALDSRTFLVKQGHQSSFNVLDLYGFDDEISVLSGTKANVYLLNNILAKFDKKPKSDVWLPIFYAARRAKKQTDFDFDEFMTNQLNQITAP
ncbi:VirB4-like protein [Moraxella macacae 0408225]|uniref:VirB4-like protein n=1 Tax=Moraxella macacae 0408225 TaxID=1230338 RepID=L2F859_9GAMM|nr:VirB4 family type IV secretion system protein [Moraxella macacae]ELA09259.1 VirB4-like protein [Moraxella macacae 0408225]